MEQNIFAEATRQKIRFTTSRGLLSVEDLWQLPLTSTKNPNLDDIARGLHAEVQASGQQSFVNKTTTVNKTVQLMFDVVKYVIDWRLAEAEAKRVDEERTVKKARILDILASKQDDNLKAMSIDQLQELMKGL